MKTHLKKNYLKKKKKKSVSSDNTLIVSVIVFLTILVVAVTVIAVYLSDAGSYVGRVNGQKIYTYEYQTFLDKAMNDQFSIMPRADANTNPPIEEIQKYFTTADENSKTPYDKAKEAAMLLAKNFKASVIMAKNAKVSLTNDEKLQYTNYIDQSIAQYTQQGMSATAITGGLSTKDYKLFALDNAQVEKYKKDKIVPTFNPTDDELSKYYTESEDLYRTLSVKVIFASKTDATGTALTAEKLAEKEANVNIWLSEINSGTKKFEEVMKEFSDEPSVKDKPDSIYTFNKANPGINDVELVNTLLKIKDVQATAEIVKTTTGTYIIKCEKIDTYQQSENDVIKNEVRVDYLNKLAQEKLNSEANSYEVKATKQKNIDKIFNEYLTSQGLK